MNSLSDLGFIHVFVAATGGNNPPTLLLLHGTGADEQDLILIGRKLCPTANLLSPRGKVLEQGMNRWFRRFAVGEYDLEDLRSRTLELADFVNRARREYSLENSKLIAVGYSNGANMAASLLATQSQLMAAAVLLRPSLNIEFTPTPSLTGARVFIASGDRDPYGGTKSATELAHQLESYGAQIEAFEYPGGHELSDGDVQAASAWIEKLLMDS